MPVTFSKKPKASKTTELAPVVLGPAKCEEPQLVSGLDPANRRMRVPVGWITDASPSMTDFTGALLQSTTAMVAELGRHPATAHSVMMDIVQLGSPPMTTGFAEIAKFRVPELYVPKTTPLHTALDRMTADLGGLFSDLRSQGIERSEAVVIITTDGYANDFVGEELDASVRKFLELGKRWSVTNLVVGVGKPLNEPLLKALANSVPPVRLEELNAAFLIPFVQKLVEQTSRSRPGQRIVVELSEGMEPIE